MEKRNSVLDWFKYFKNNFLLDACAGLIAFAIGMIISIIMWKTGVMEWGVPFGTGFMTGAFLMMALFASMMSFSQQFNIAVAMGCSRRRFLSAFFGTTAVFSVVELLMLWVLYHLEMFVYRCFIPAQEGNDVEASIGEVLDLKIVLTILVAAIVFKFVSGMIALHFGRPGFYVVWFGYMILIFGAGNIATRAADNPDGICAEIMRKVCEILTFWNGLGSYLVIYAVLAILLLVFGRMQLRQEVRSA